MRKILMATVLTAIVGTSSLGFAAGTPAASDGPRTCSDHGGYTAVTGWNAGTWQDLGRDGVEACSNDGGVDGALRAGYGQGSAYAAVDIDGSKDDYVYVTTGENLGAYCGKGRYDEPAGFDEELDAPETRDRKRTDSCT